MRSLNAHWGALRIWNRSRWKFATNYCCNMSVKAINCHITPSLGTKVWCITLSLKTKYCHKGLPALKNLKITPLAGKVTITDFWDVNGVLHLECMPVWTIILLWTPYQNGAKTESMYLKRSSLYDAHFPPTNQCKASHKQESVCRRFITLASLSWTTKCTAQLHLPYISFGK